MRTAAAILSFTLLASGGDAQAQPDALRGPAVKEREKKPTIVERDMAGRLKRPELPPEEAAIAPLNVSAESQNKLDEFFADRAATLDQIVLDNLELVVRFYNAKQAGDRRDQLSLLADLMRKLTPLNAKGKLADQVRALLPDDKAKLYDTVLAEYRAAAIADARTEARRRNESVNDRQLETRENLASLGVEIKRSYERQIASKAAEFDKIIAQLDLRSEQEAKVRAIVTDFTQATRGKATAEQRRALFFKIMAELDSDQQKKLVALYLGN
jgi:hypothetical protein